MTSKLSNDNSMSYDTSRNNDKPSVLVYIFVVLVLLSLVKNIGFYFPASDISGVINLNFRGHFMP